VTNQWSAAPSGRKLEPMTRYLAGAMVIWAKIADLRERIEQAYAGDEDRKATKLSQDLREARDQAEQLELRRRGVAASSVESPRPTAPSTA
jgi:hypothetical protein